jgi:RNA polymerase sigma factor (sigma-70 family)
MSAHRLASPEMDRVFQGESISGLSEWQLLERYLEHRDEAAFEALVTLHGPMVLGVCRRALGFSPDADDAFQATFLVLIRRARDLGPRDAIGPWLYGVARRVAARARRRGGQRSELVPLEFSVADRADSRGDPELVEILDQELCRLPAKYRSPLVLCYLEGRSHEEAARVLQWPVGTVKGRLSRARELMRSRLARRGLAPSSGAIFAISSPDLRGALDRSLVERTVTASARLATGQSVAQVVSQSVTSLVEGVLAAMFVNKFKWAAPALVAAGVALTSAAVLGRQQEKKPAPPAADVKVDGVSRPGAVTVETAPAPPGGERAKPASARNRRTTASDLLEPGRDDDPRSLRILEKLEEPISMSFANETPIDDVLKYIKQATTSPTYAGIPIYVDPVGLQEAERSMNSTIQIDLEGIPLRRTLQLMLTQLGLAYFVQDGILIITSDDLAHMPLPPAVATPAPIAKMLEKSERGELTSTELKELIEVIKLRRQVRLMHEAYETPYGGGGSGGGGGFGGINHGTFPGEEGVSETKQLLKEVRELVEVLMSEKKPATSKADKPDPTAGGGRGGSK